MESAISTPIFDFILLPLQAFFIIPDYKIEPFTGPGVACSAFFGIYT